MTMVPPPPAPPVPAGWEFRDVFVGKRGGMRPRWVASWKTNTGFIHDELPYTTHDLNKEEAREYAAAHPPVRPVRR